MPAENCKSDRSSLNWEEFFGEFCICLVFCLSIQYGVIFWTEFGEDALCEKQTPITNFSRIFITAVSCCVDIC